MEEWRDIYGYEGKYKVSNLGNIKSLNYNNTNKAGLLSIHINHQGYCTVNLCINGNQKLKRVHQLVAMAFLNHKPCGFKLVVNHINFIKTDNRVENLEIVTARENTNKKHLTSSSEYTGVSWHKKHKKWKSALVVNGITKHLGLFDIEEEASQYYENALIAVQNNEDIQVKTNNYSSNYLGVCWSKSNKKWMAYTKINRKSKYIGVYETEIEAKEAHDAYINIKVN